MRILMVSNLYPPYLQGGYEIRCKQISDGLSAQGHDVHILTSDYQVKMPTSEDHIYRLLPYTPTRYHLSRTENFALEWRTAKITRRILRKVRPDVIYIWNMWSIPPSATLTLEKSGIRVIYQIDQNWIIEGLPQDYWLQRWQVNPTRLWKSRLRRLLPPILKRLGIATKVGDLRLDEVIFLSNHRQDEHLNHPLPVQKAYLIYSGVHIPDEIHRRTQYEELRLIYVSRYFTPMKGILTAVKALRQVIEKQGYNTIHLDVIGEFHPSYPDYNAEVMAQVEAIKSHITFHGPLPHDQIPALYLNHDVLVFCANHPEGLPLVIAEAMSHGLPVIGSPPGGAAEILRPEASLTFPIDDHKALSEHIIRLQEDWILWEKLSQGAVEFIKKEFSLDRCLKQTETVLLEGE